MKVALCFIISYDHKLNKELLWKEWIEPNKDIINVYFYYKDFKKIKSKWIIDHALPPDYIHDTSYFYVISAYMSVMKYAVNSDPENMWFSLLTDSCCPIISPKRFRYLFFTHYNKSVFSWAKAWWNPERDKRANLSKIPKEFWLANDPWFTLTRRNVLQIAHFVQTKQEIVNLINSGGLANETLFAVIFYMYKEIGDHGENDVNKKDGVICMRSHLADWARSSSSTSPHVFKNGDKKDIAYIEKNLNENPYAMFIRKVAPEFPDKVMRHYIYQHNAAADSEIIIQEPVDKGLSGN